MCQRATEYSRRYPDGPPFGGPKRISQNANAFEGCLGFVVPSASHRADHRDCVPGSDEGSALLPNATVEWNRQVLDEDQDVAHPWVTASSAWAPGCTPDVLRGSGVTISRLCRYSDVATKNNGRRLMRMTFSRPLGPQNRK